MRLCWNTPLGPDGVAKGIYMGYSSSAVALGRAVARAGVELDPDAPTVVHYTFPMDFRPVPGKRNILFTMYEALPIPPAFVPYLDQADAVFVPSRFCQSVFSTVVRRRPLRRVPLGFDPASFYPRTEPRPWSLDAWRPGAPPLRFLWCGAPNERKGWPQLTQSWSWVLQNEPWCELLFKTTDETSEGAVLDVARNVRVDTRVYDDTELGDLYRASDVFVFPSHGEGFGLTALEALACGVPVIAVKHGGALEFLADGNCAWAPYALETVERPLGPARYAFATLGGLARVMLEVARHYPRYVERAARGAEAVRRRFTWDHSAAAFVAAVESLGWEELRATA